MVLETALIVPLIRKSKYMTLLCYMLLVRGCGGAFHNVVFTGRLFPWPFSSSNNVGRRVEP